MAIINLITCDNVIEATFIKNNLENEGIQCFLTNEISSTLLPGYNRMFNAGIQIMINENDFEKAFELVPGSEIEKKIICPACNSTNISFRIGKSELKKYLLIALSLSVATPIGTIKENYYCKDCKTEF